MAKKLTPAQVTALQYFEACRSGVPAAERRRRQLKYPSKRVLEVLFERKLIENEERPRKDFCLGCTVIDRIPVITEAGQAALAEITA